MNQSTTINFLKVFATVLVFTQHSTIVANQELGFELQGFAQQLLNTPAQGGVWMFLIIGGFLASWGFTGGGKYELNAIGCKNYYKNRVIKILIPTWIFISLAWLINDGAYTFKPIEFIKLITCTYNGSGIGIPGVGATWYIFIVMWLYILTPLGLRLFNWLEEKYKGNEARMYMIVIALLFIYGIVYRCGCEALHLSKHNWRYANILACGDCYFIGVAAFKLQGFIDINKSGNRKKLKAAYAALITVVLMCTLKNYSIVLKAFHALISPSLYAVICAAIILFSKQNQLEGGRIWNTLAPYTFAFYLWHSLVMIRICRCMELDESFGSYSIVACLGFVITSYMAYLMTNMNGSIIKALNKNRK